MVEFPTIPAITVKEKNSHLAICKDEDSRHGGDGKVGRQVAAVFRHNLQDPQGGLLAGAIAVGFLLLFQHSCHIFAGTTPG